MTDTNQLPEHTITINDHPEPRIMQWSGLELAAIKKYAESYALKARAQVHPAQAEVTDADIVAVMRDGNNCNYNDEAEHIQFARAILTLRPAAVPMTDEQVDELCGEANRGYFIGREEYFKAFRNAEHAHGITAQAKKEGV